MSFLNSVLSSIGGKEGAPTTSTLPTTRPQGEQITRDTNRVRDPTSSNDTKNIKRRAEDAFPTFNSKAPKTSSTSSPRAGLSRETTSQLPPGNIKPQMNRPLQSTPYRGTSKPTPPPKTQADPTREAPKEAKKGSYKEIMARAQATQAKAPAVGAISHKPKDKMAVSYKKELKLKKKAMKDKRLGNTNGSRPSSSDGQGIGLSSASVGNKKAPQPAYPGMAKPQPKPQPAYKGTMIAANAGNKKVAQPPKRRANEYAATDDELEDEDEEEEDGYGDVYESEESDDMEADFSDVQQEESAAAKAARKEDEEEARLEAKLKSEKEERRKKLEQMAKKAKPQRY